MISIRNAYLGAAIAMVLCAPRAPLERPWQ
jgi:hypothetical protein